MGQGAEAKLHSTLDISKTELIPNYWLKHILFSFKRTYIHT